MFRTAKPCRYVPNSGACGTRSRSVQENKKREAPQGCFSFFGAPAENRTPDTLIKSQVLYQLSYRGVRMLRFRTVIYYHNLIGLSILFLKKEQCHRNCGSIAIFLFKQEQTY